jgi:hypothetical protein
VCGARINGAIGHLGIPLVVGIGGIMVADGVGGKEGGVRFK